MSYYILSFIIAFFACFLINYPIRALARYVEFYDLPGERKVHKKAIPYGGGVGIYLGLVITLIAVFLVYPPAIFFKRDIMGIILGGALVVTIGLWDDARGAGAALKFSLEAVIAVLMYYFGFRIEKMSVPGLGTVELGWFGILITIFWYLIMMNAINLIDGLDGLASGVTGIATITILIITHQRGNPFETILACAIIGLSMGFLPHNFHPARLFMGDTGSLMLGFLLGSLTLTTSTKAPAFLTLIIPLVAVGMPIFDTAHAFFRRIMTGQHPFRADTKHLHHRLLNLGLSHTRAVLLLYYISAYLGVMAYILSRTSSEITVIVVLLLMVGLFLAAENVSTLTGKGGEKGA
ncbi:undecaprenyl/decaprenyl-phosphate alpha-N-acetylglucosaminyl 1-phosphate transferase [Candidatus Sumerlaeota bacterium]|nr:undecaprenyl/decaprenyl-phosphate alpha-N-acetylglucosaminyl 1-phosphate transferase [Candidatus Sumerlaeota bacterium]